MINLIVWVCVGAFIGWLTYLILRGRSSLLLNVLVGVVGTVSTGYLLNTIFHVDTINQNILSIPALLLSVCGGAALLAAVNLFRFYRMRATTYNVLESKWKKVRVNIHTRWNRLSEEDIDQIDGQHERFIGLIQERYGCDKKVAENQLRGYINAVAGRL
jgi:uncharacterized membrane protein YeaQ/YmgE (transglycosylase-associated protein family)/uncharacterized protein YjbJ (UPF0337 family)